MSGFSFAGVKDLNTILDVDKSMELTPDAIALLWKEYHSEKMGSIGWVAPAVIGKRALKRAEEENCRFFITPVFETAAPDPATAGYYNLVVQYFSPAHFVLADMGQYQNDPANASPLLSFSIFSEFAAAKNLTLIRADIVSPALEEGDARKIIAATLANFDGNDDEDSVDWVNLFNNDPEKFDFEKFVEEQRASWFKSKEDREA